MLLEALDESEQQRDQTLLHIQNYKHFAKNYYNKKFCARLFKFSDLVLRKVYENIKECRADSFSIENKAEATKHFGEGRGNTVLLGGDVRQMLPLVSQGSREDTILASLSRSYLCPARKRAILTPTNEIARKVNSYLLSVVPSSMAEYLSLGSIENESTPQVITQLGNIITEAEMMTSTHVWEKVFIPRIQLFPNERMQPFNLRKCQYPLMSVLPVTINKSKGQTLTQVALYLPKSVFIHEQFYVAFSRMITRNNLGVTNIVYNEIFNNLHS
ncbi:hypothetical protein N665_0538s0007 [Sinapis alba]|nr:hypothetical protein N665_0538s0007 [Sinapis alba]